MTAPTWNGLRFLWARLRIGIGKNVTILRISVGAESYDRSRFLLGCDLRGLVFLRGSSRSIRLGSFDIAKYGAVGDGNRLNSAAINEAIDAAHAAGGGTVYFPPGTWLSGSIHLKSNVTLFLEPGATILATSDPKAYDRSRAQSVGQISGLRP